MKFQNADVMIATPCYGGMEVETIMCVQRLYEWSKWYAPSDDKKLPVNNIEWVFPQAPSPAWVRNATVDIFLKSKHRSLLMIDRDHIFHQSYLKTLFEADKEIIGALATTKINSFEDLGKRPIIPNCSQEYDGKIVPVTQMEVNQHIAKYPEEPMEVSLNGMGMILIKRKVFETVLRPWFAQPESNYENNPMGVSGEDYYFSKKAREYGFKTWIHPLCPIVHIGKGYYGMGLG